MEEHLQLTRDIKSLGSVLTGTFLTVTYGYDISSVFALTDRGCIHPAESSRLSFVHIEILSTRLGLSKILSVFS